ncbi:HNH endonuclease family protein [Micromonosporaceae bacterium Da 78-11]
MGVPPRTPHWTLSLASAALILLTAAGCEVQPGGSPTATPTGDTAPDSAAAKDQLDKLVVVQKTGTMAGYKREKFPHWRSTGENCDVRDTVLKRDGTKVKLSGCNVVAGTWKSVYDDKTLDSPTLVDIDHVVPLANAWRSGAAAWTTDQRGDFANDLDEPQLVAVSAGSNRSKGDQDPSTWKPPATDNWCEYATDWIVVKSHWKLTITAKEKTALEDMLRKC